jgi:hypothetical protein
MINITADAIERFEDAVTSKIITDGTTLEELANIIIDQEIVSWHTPHGGVMFDTDDLEWEE